MSYDVVATLLRAALSFEFNSSELERIVSLLSSSSFSLYILQCSVVKLTSNLFGKALSRRIKATILFASETGKSEKFANTLAELFNHAFNAQVLKPGFFQLFNINST